MIIKRINIRIIRKPRQPSLNEELQWFANSLGLFGMRDKDKSCFRIFIELMKATKSQIALSSDDIAYHLNLTRGTVVHHINHLIESGLVVPVRKKYILRDPSLTALLAKVKQDFDNAYEDMALVAKDIDAKLGRE